MKGGVGACVGIVGVEGVDVVRVTICADRTASIACLLLLFRLLGLGQAVAHRERYSIVLRYGKQSV